MFDGYGFLIDMDGVIYSGGKLIPGATEFIGELLESNRPLCFLQITVRELDEIL